ncbi:PASTA domain-containing protein [Nonomuraea sediminis]|uniref:PASTA domain-containing protein n=1 Tax=Nonomuraea sediminis TaxID=2835864 RepID=UPI001BDBD5B1|nr:PASTA domain-containing protein [Nonomuraea sediminis]
MGLALTAPAAALVLGRTDDRASAPSLAPASTIAETPLTDVATMPELWSKDVTSASVEIAALGFTAQITRANPDGIADPKEWVVAGQLPAPGTLLKTSMRIFLQVFPKETASRHRGS